MQDLNRKINSRMARFSFLSFIVIVSVVWLQLWYLKHFFEKKKIV
jgi:emp24/gp25L/p24 family/GOLD